MKNPMELLNTFFILPALKAGIEHRVWESKNPGVESIRKIWENLDLIEGNKLTLLGMQIEELYPMILYFSSLKEDFFDFNTHNKYEINSVQYEHLRKGLGAFRRNRGFNLFKANEISGESLKVLDYCGGDGQYLVDFLEENPDSTGVLLDRNPAFRREFGEKVTTLSVDFEKEPSWWKPYVSSFDFIILSEVLHCKNKGGRRYLLNTCQRLLKPGGRLFINEIVPDPIFDWRMFMYTQGGKSLSKDDIYELLPWNHKWKFLNKSHRTSYHYNIILEKDSENAL